LGVRRRQKQGRVLFFGVFGLLLVALCWPGGVGAGSYQHTLEWAGHGSENAGVGEDCTAGFWHWVLTPGGNATITAARLTVQYAGGDTSVTGGYSRNPQGRGAWHFDVEYSAHQVAGAFVEFNTAGEGKENFILTISDSRCLEKDKNGDDGNGDDENGDDENGDDENGDDENGDDNGDEDLPPTGGLPLQGIGLLLMGAGLLLGRKRFRA
jgi:hypothetical protein